MKKYFKKTCKNNKLKISAPTWNEEFELPNRSYSVSDYFTYIFKKHENVTGNSSIMTYINKLENRITFKKKTGYHLEHLTPKTMKLLGIIKSKIILLTAIISKIQECRMHLFLINHLVNY